ncbi:MAG: LysM peptidoglycan-binding domain-containing protein [bacterium]|nr:LysM peptidoglycan-binding domain-containing protein [bacterium]
MSIGSQSPQSGGDVLASVSSTASQAAPAMATDNPSVDQVIATNIAADLAERADLPVSANISNLSISLAAKSQLAQSGDSLSYKPSIASGSLESRDVIKYKVKSGESMSDLVDKFNISKDTIRWANGLSSNTLKKGQTLRILPVDGIMYTSKSGDTIDGIASQYGSDKALIVSYNNLELASGHLKKGTRLILPGGEKETPTQSTSGRSGGSSYGGSNGGISRSFARAAVGNRYALGNCTWYAYNRRAELGMPIGSFWGNANTWGLYASAAGYAVNGTPKKGAVFQSTAGYYGHVGIVESVNSDGSINVSEMNNIALGGFNIVNTRTISAGEVGQYRYIH